MRWGINYLRNYFCCMCVFLCIDGDVEVEASDIEGQTAGGDRGTQDYNPTEAAKVPRQYCSVMIH